jgi:heat-inducible transcriptional repressor
MVDERRAAILQAVVQEYIETSQPVSSASVSGAPSVSASPATVRSDMAALEQDGYLQQPHTSAGRIPTDRGYRFFVDSLALPGHLGPAQQKDVRNFFEHTRGEIEGLLHETSRLLAHLTGAASVVVGPDHETTTVKSLQLVGINAHTAIAVVVYSTGRVEKRTLDIEGADEQLVNRTSNALQKAVAGRVLSSVKEISSGEFAIDALAGKVLQALSDQADDLNDQVFVGGAARLAGAFDAIDVVSGVLGILEQQYVVVTLIRDLLDRGISVSIGEENSVQSLARCSLVVAPTVIDGEQRGSVAVLGPTRMDYSQAVAAVTIVGKRLGERLAEA